MTARHVAILLAAVLAGCAVAGRADPAGKDRLVLRGELVSPERVDLTPDSLAIVELRADGAGPPQLVAEQRRQLDGRPLPVPFELSVDSSALESRRRLVFRGAIVATRGPMHVTEPVEIEARSGIVQLGPLRLRRVERIAFGRSYRCGDTLVVFGALGPHPRMIVGGEAFDLEPAESASGARYEAIDGSDTRFWSKGDRATVTVRGVDLPECRAIVEPGPVRQTFPPGS